jgi:hypothetical protein
VVHLALWGCWLALLAPGDSQETPKLSATFTEIPSSPDGPGILCEGTTDLPDGCLVELTLFYGKADDGAHIAPFMSVPVQKGKFSHTFQVYPAKNLPGEYVVRMSFTPDLQRQQYRKIPMAQVESKFPIGEPSQFEAGRNEVREQLQKDVRAFLGMADEISKEYAKVRGKLDRAAWDRRVEDWKKRTTDLNHRVLATPEYRVLQFRLLNNGGLEHLGGIILELARCARESDEKALREGRARLDQEAQGILEEYKSQPVDPAKYRLELLEDARKVLSGSRGLTEAKLATAKGKFNELMLRLNLQCPPSYRDRIRSILEAGTKYFVAADERQGDLDALYAKVERPTAELLEALKKEK